MSKFYFLLFQQIVQSLVNQLGVDSAHANISTSSSVSVIVGIICLNFSLLVDSYMCNFVSERNTFITFIEWYSTLLFIIVFSSDYFYSLYRIKIWSEYWNFVV